MSWIDLCCFVVSHLYLPIELSIHIHLGFVQKVKKSLCSFLLSLTITSIYSKEICFDTKLGLLRTSLAPT